MSARHHAIVVGGGIAGIAAAVRLTDLGWRVTLLEATRRLGGRATSHVDPETGEEIDNCQHVTMGACAAYEWLLGRLGVADAIEWSGTQTWLRAGCAPTRLEAGALPAPLHYAGAFARARFLSGLDKAAIGGAMAAIARADREAWRGRTFGEFLLEHAQPEATVRRFWSPVVVSACNLGVERVSATVALMVFQEGLLAGAGAARIGVPRVALGRLWEGVEWVLERGGGGVRLGARVRRVEIEDGASGGARGVVARMGDGLEMVPDAVVVALPPARVGEVLPTRLRELLRFERVLEHSPILGVHLRCDRPILSVAHAVLVERGTQWLFRKDAPGRCVHAVISAADEWMGMGEQQIVERVWADVAACVPGAGDARVLWARAIKQRQATFAATPAFEAVRPEAGLIEAGVPIALAGDYTRTGWPATMEGATRSGVMAAEAVAGCAKRC
ncbi:MAG: FAD-dependent oxidoreductase [Phycisphaeraceae bacterium]|nr:FAD-dependent oxidoreductase [Phycisphaeraceae bacterium]